MIKIKDEHIAKLLEQIENDKELLKELNIKILLDISSESLTLSKTKSAFHDIIKTEYIFGCGKLVKEVTFNNKHFESKKLGIYDHFLVVSKTMYCEPGFFTDEKDDIIDLYNKVISANKTLNTMNGFE